MVSPLIGVFAYLSRNLYLFSTENCPETVTLFSQEEINNDDQELDDVSLHRIEGTRIQFKLLTQGFP